MMGDFDKTLAESTARGANIVPGCVLGAIDNTGKQFYSKSSGYDSVAPDAPHINPDGVFWIASCTKLIGTIAAMQCVERGQITLDEPISGVLHELSNPEILSQTGSGDVMARTVETSPATTKITLRHLLTHSSGLAYDLFDPNLMAWRVSTGGMPLTLSGKVIEAHSVPLLYQPGEGWSYSGGIDWAGVMVSRLNGGISLEEYLQKNVFGPLGMKSTSFRFEKHPELQKLLINTSERAEDGSLKESKKLWPDYAEEDCAGAGLYSTVSDYLKVIGDILKSEPTVLKRETIDKMFAPQLGADSSALKGLLANKEIFAGMTGDSDITSGINFGLGGLYVEADIGIAKKGSLMWGGLPNLRWFANREQGVAAMYASQVIPPGDPKTTTLVHEFEKDVWRTKASLG